ncbi:ABC transporter permease [Phenylobacterium immobile]|uniref:ABC transporter permease n=1 Tax=Phenylobacterium immobile TaxID=21 RepID=UPI000ADDAAAD|nr:ABC transporter permease [Phenylobacterium immobile]
MDDSASAALVGRAATPPPAKVYTGVNWRGMTTLYMREIRRFWKVGAQTLAAPVVTALLYMMVFVVAAQGARPIHGVEYGAFVAPGLIMMQVLNNAFANSSSSLMQAKFSGLMGDFLTPPLTPGEHVFGFGMGAATRGVVVGLITWAVVAPFAHVGVAHLWALLYFGAAASVIMAMIGIFAGLWAEKFDHMSVVTNFIVMPMTFLSGTFYLVERLPEPFRTFSHYNPMFYLIDGFRYGMLGHAEGSLTVGVLMTLALSVGLTIWCHRLFAVGYKIKT